MPWEQPPEAIRAQVNAIIGGDIYAEASRRYARVLQRLGLPELPSTVQGRSWFRTTEAARFSQHKIGLAVDAQIRDATLRAQVAAALRAEGFHVIPHSRGRLHAQALTPAEFQRFRPLLQAAGLFGGAPGR